MNVRAKMRCVVITPFNTGRDYDKAAEVRLMPVTNDSPENAAWSKYTPSGELRLVITNEAAIQAFEAGKEYLVDITPA